MPFFDRVIRSMRHPLIIKPEISKKYCSFFKIRVIKVLKKLIAYLVRRLIESKASVKSSSLQNRSAKTLRNNHPIVGSDDLEKGDLHGDLQNGVPERHK